MLTDPLTVTAAMAQHRPMTSNMGNPFLSVEAKAERTPIPVPESPAKLVLERLELYVDVTHARLNDLESRIHPVLLPDYPIEAPKSIVGRDSINSPLLLAIDDQLARISMLNDRIGHLIERVNL